MKTRNAQLLKYAILCVASLFMISSLFTGCKDYDSDIDNLQKQIDETKTALTQLRSAVDKGEIILHVEWPLARDHA